MTVKNSKTYASPEMLQAYQQIADQMGSSPVANNERLANLALYLTPSNLGHLLFMSELYRKIIPLHGIVVEFGTRWGRNLAIWTTCRSLYEPLNYNRKIVGFDTFAGFPSVSERDGSSESVEVGFLSVTENTQAYLDNLLDQHEQLAPYSHLRKHELVVGDVTHTLPEYLEAHPETIVALAYFDLDLYEPTLACLEALRPHLVKGSILGFDELNSAEYPGETIALRESGFNAYRLNRDPISGYRSWLEVE